MPVRKAEAEWSGNLREGKGHMSFGNGAFDGAYSFRSRFEEGTGTNPEELIGAAHAGCFSMALAGLLAQAGFPPERVHTTANVHLDKVITKIVLQTEVEAPGIDEETFQQTAASAKENCPVSKALKGVEIQLEARLTRSAGTAG